MLNKRVRWLIAIFITSQILALIIPEIGLAVKGNLTILHTNDIHSHLSRFSCLATKIKEIKQEKAERNEPVLLLDSCDFIVGTLYHMLTTTASPELTLMNILEFDATTLGNHEFDWGPQALAKLIDIARVNGGGLTVPIIASNIRFNLFDSRDNDLKRLYDAGVIRRYLVKTLSNGLKVGIIGLLGKEAEQKALQSAPVKFNHNKDFIQHMVNVVRSKGVDLVILLSHSGLDEDKELAKLIKGIDIIMAGHCHTALFQPIRVANTLIVEAGSYTKYLGKLEVFVDDGKVSLCNYQLIPINDTIPKDFSVQRVINHYTNIIDRKILNPIGLESDESLAETDFNLIGEAEFVSETNLGDLVTDGMRFAIDSYQSGDSVDFTFQPTGFIRGDIETEIIKISDAFRIIPLGIGPDMEPGYPLVSFYLNAQEIKKVLEISVYIALSRGREYLLQVSGLRFWYNPLQPMFRKVTKIEKWDSITGYYISLDTSNIKTFYKIGTNLFLVDLLSFVKKYVPWLSIVPKDKEGNPIPFSTFAGKKKILVDKDPANKGIQEVKEWQAFIKYLSHFSDLDGDLIPDIPLVYAQTQGRINTPSEKFLSYYRAKRKNPWVGIGAALVFPSLGHVYAKDWYPRGLKFFLIEIGSLALASKESTRTLGLLALICFKIWECGDAYEAVMDHNKKLVEKYHITFSLNQEKVRVALGCRF